MRQMYVAVGVMLLAGSGAVFLLRGATEEVMGPGIAQGTDTAQALAPAQSVPTAAGEVVAAFGNPEAEPTPTAVDDWYAEAAPEEEEPDLYGPDETAPIDEGEFFGADEEPVEDEGEFNDPEEVSAEE